MASIKFLSSLSNKQLKDILETIDVVFLDIDGVLVTLYTPIEGAGDCILKLRQLGKKIGFVTNNTTKSIEALVKNVSHCGAKDNEIHRPNEVTTSFLKSIDFIKDIYLVGCSLLKNDLTNAGFNVIEYRDIHTDTLPETFSYIIEVLQKAMLQCKNVGAVMICFDFNFQHQAIHVAAEILRQMPNVLLLSGANDDSARFMNGVVGIGPKYYIDGIERWSNKACIQMAKPGKIYGESLISKYGITDPSRVLFIGDNPETDTAFGKALNFKTMLVLSGITTRDQAENWKFPENQKPDYVADSLGDVFNRIKDF